LKKYVLGTNDKFIEDRSGPRHPSHGNEVHEGNFDVDGDVESLGSSSPRGSDRGPKPMEIQQRRKVIQSRKKNIYIYQNKHVPSLSFGLQINF
jgi:hypothetical protein